MSTSFCKCCQNIFITSQTLSLNMSQKVFPILDSYTKSKNISNESIEKLRIDFNHRVAKSPELYYLQDIKKINENDWNVRRFLYNYSAKPDSDKGLEAMDRAMKWRKAYGVLDITEEDIPQELYISGGAFVYGTDLNGSPILILRSKVAIKSKTWIPVFHKFLVYLVEKIDSRNESKGLTLLVDCQDTGLHNIDMDLLKFMYTLFNDYYPCLLNASLTYKMPKVAETIFRVMRTWLCDEQRKHNYLIGKKTINRFVASDQLPSVLMGTNPLSFRTVPESAPSLHELAQRLDIDLAKADKLVAHLQKFYRT